MSLVRLLKKILLPWSHESVLFEVTPRCNLNCVYCYNVWKDDVGYSKEELPTDKALKLIDKIIKQSRCQQFSFTGGEPLLRDDLEILVKKAASKCQEVLIITNGTLLTEEKVKSLIDSGVSLFELPLNSGNKTIHNSLSGSDNSFDNVVQAAANIRYYGAELAFVFVATKQNIAKWPEALELGIALGASGFLFNRYNAGGTCHHNPESLMPSVQQIYDALAIANDYAIKYNVGIGASIAIPPCLIDTGVFPHVGFGYCAAGTDNAYYTIDPLGNVRPCNHTPTIIGNLFQASLKEITSSKELKTFKQARPGFCQGCQMEHECLGGCKAAAEVCYGSIYSCEPFIEINKSLAKQGKASVIKPKK